MLNQRHILYLQPSELFGGAERQIAAVLPQLQKQRVKVTALVGPGRTIVDWLESACVRDVVHSELPSRHGGRPPPRTAAGVAVSALWRPGRTSERPAVLPAVPSSMI